MNKVLAVACVCGIAFATLPLAVAYVCENFFPKDKRDRLPAHRVVNHFSKVMD